MREAVAFTRRRSRRAEAPGAPCGILMRGQQRNNGPELRFNLLETTLGPKTARSGPEPV